MIEPNIIIIIPTYNNAQTLRGVVEACKAYAPVLVVNDGSTDSTQEILDSISGISQIGYKNNKGKGFALKMGFEKALELGFTHAITIETNAQIKLETIAGFITQAKLSPEHLLVGTRNLKSLTNKFSSFWFRLQTGTKLTDTQCGFRVYPLFLMGGIKTFCSRKDFELEILVKSIWRGIKVESIPVDAHDNKERVLGFCLLNFFLLFGAIFYFYPIKAFNYIVFNIKHNNDSNLKLAFSIGLGVFCGILPIWGYQLIFACLAAHFLKLNKAISIIFSNISLPPILPFILYGSYNLGYILQGKNTSLSIKDISLEKLYQDIFSYILGSLSLAVIAGLVFVLISLIMLKLFRKEPNA